MASSTVLTDNQLKQKVQELIDNDDPALTVPRVRSKGGTLALSICKAIGGNVDVDPARIHKILLSRATDGRIAVFRGSERIARVDSDSIRHAKRVRRIVSPAVDSSSTSGVAGPPIGPSPSNRAHAEAQKSLREAYLDKLTSYRWTAQTSLVRDIVVWFLLSQPEYTCTGTIISRTSILEAANQDPTDKRLLQALSTGMEKLKERGFIDRTTHGRATTMLRLTAIPDDATIEELHRRFNSSATPAQVTQELPDDETVEEALRRVVRSELTDFRAKLADDLIEALGIAVLGQRVEQMESAFRLIATSLATGLEELQQA